MKRTIIGLILITVAANWSIAQNSAIEQEIKDLSKQKWQWMADKNVDRLSELFHDDSRFIHMSGTWGKERELEIIKTGSIWYKKADVHDVAVEVLTTPPSFGTALHLRHMFGEMMCRMNLRLLKSIKNKRMDGNC